MPLSLIALIVLGVASLAAAGFVFMGERSRQDIVARTADRAPAFATPSFARGPSLSERIARRIAVVAPETWTASEKTEHKLVQAGHDSATAPLVYSAVRVLLGIMLPLIALLIVPKHSFNAVVLDVAAAVLVALIIPPFVLVRQVRKRQETLRRSLPDALDLLVVCIEAGISLDAALLRVAKDLAGVHPELADELLVVTQKTNVGMPRAEALRGLWTRTGVEQIRALVSHVVQAEKWGTSIGKVLRVYSETLRRQRRQAAEKKAATAPVKMLIPLGLLIFPALMLVIMGPIIMSVMTLFDKK